MRLLVPLLLAIVLMPARAAAQPSIDAWDGATGEVTPADSALGDGRRYDLYRFQARAGHTYVIFTWADFDLHLSAGRRPGARCGAGCVETTRSRDRVRAARLDFVPEATGTYFIRVAGAFAGEAGHYEVRLEEYDDVSPDVVVTTDTMRVGVAPATDTIFTVTTVTDTSTVVVPGVDTVAAVPAMVLLDSVLTSGHGSLALPADTAQAPATELRPGMAVKGVLDPWDRRSALDSSYFDLYTYRTYRRGETIVIRMKSDAFDTEVRVVHVQAGTWVLMGFDDDGGEGTDSELTITFPDPGEYEIHARSFARSRTGPYTLSVERR